MRRAALAALLALSAAVSAQPEKLGHPSGVPPAPPAVPPGAPTKDVGFDQRLGETVPLELAFKDETGRDVKLGDYFGKKPVLLSLVYFGCPMLCGMATEGLVRSLKPVKFLPGDEFTVLTVSFDPGEGPAMAAEKRSGVLRALNRPGAEKGWHFLTGSEASVKALTRAVGFRYVWDAESKQWAHATGVVALTPHGRIARYFFGIEYAAKHLQFGLMEAATERIGSVVDQLLLLCYHYDPKMGRYTPAILGILKVAAAATILIVGAAVLLMLRLDKRKEQVAHVA